MKSRYMSSDQPGYDEQRRFDDTLAALGLYDRDDYFPSQREIEETLSLHGHRVDGFDLVSKGER